MKKQMTKLWTLAFLLTLGFVACESDEETITTNVNSLEKGSEAEVESKDSKSETAFVMSAPELLSYATRRAESALGALMLKEVKGQRVLVSEKSEEWILPIVVPGQYLLNEEKLLNRIVWPASPRQLLYLKEVDSRALLFMSGEKVLYGFIPFLEPYIDEVFEGAVGVKIVEAHSDWNRPVIAKIGQIGGRSCFCHTILSEFHELCWDCPDTEPGSLLEYLELENHIWKDPIIIEELPLFENVLDELIQ